MNNDMKKGAFHRHFMDIKNRSNNRSAAYVSFITR